MTMCRKCKTRKATGILIELCDECFDIFHAEVMSRPVDASGRRELFDSEVKYMSDSALTPGYRNKS
jgi:hypothetical protein